MKRFIFVAAILLNVVKGKIESYDSEVLFLFQSQFTYSLQAFTIQKEFLWEIDNFSLYL